MTFTRYIFIVSALILAAFIVRILMHEDSYRRPLPNDEQCASNAYNNIYWKNFDKARTWARYIKDDEKRKAMLAWILYKEELSKDPLR